jgi:hypothetical protein
VLGECVCVCVGVCVGVCVWVWVCVSVLIVIYLSVPYRQGSEGLNFRPNDQYQLPIEMGPDIEWVNSR